jgi:pimeloyl-ACP methyl ester carboxylesterase
MSHRGPVATVVSHNVPIEFTRPSGQVGVVSVGHPETAGITELLQHANVGAAAGTAPASASLVAVRGQTVQPRSETSAAPRAAVAAFASADTYQLSKYVADIGAVLQELGTAKTPLMGYSQGGYFTVQFALAHPDRVSALILIEPALYTPREELLKRAKLAESGKDQAALEEMLNYVAPKTPGKPAAASEIARYFVSPQALAASFKVRAEHPVDPRSLKKLTMPVLLIGGTASEVGSTVNQTAQHIPHADVWWIRGANHVQLVEPPYNQEVGGVINAFMRGI